MKLPGADHAIVDGAKARDYLLSPEHPVGRFKAVFFGTPDVVTVWIVLTGEESPRFVTAYPGEAR
jgi:hypothetical protein